MWELEATGEWRFREHEVSTVRQLRQQYFPLVDLLDEELEILIPYVSSLLRVGVDLENSTLQDSMGAHYNRIEAAMLRTLEYAQRLHTQGRDFDNGYHPTNHLARGLREAWIPFDSAFTLKKFCDYCQALNPEWKWSRSRTTAPETAPSGQADGR
jgi:hypothetical protein